MLYVVDDFTCVYLPSAGLDYSIHLLYTSEQLCFGLQQSQTVIYEGSYLNSYHLNNYLFG